MPVSKSIIPDAELNVLKVLWKGEAPLTVREIAQRLYKNTNTSSVGTVQKLLTRLEKKNMLQRDNSKQSHTFIPLLDREDVAGLQLAECAQKLSGGSLFPFVMHLVQSRKLSEDEKQEIRRLLNE